MEQTFMTIHNLTPDANILFASESIVDILGYTPQEVRGRSSFDYFHPDEVPFARSVHSRGVLLDKAAVLHYARILSRDGRWISCECCFTIVHDVLVACTSIYRQGEKSERRAFEAPQIRRLFSCSPRDPRYHMLEHLSPKFKMPPTEREPRAALILNRFTRTLTVMFATEAIGAILGVPANHILHKSFYECIQESCLDDALKCLESAKANDSIAYLRFWSRDPRRPEDFEEIEEPRDDHSQHAENEYEQDNNFSYSSDAPYMPSGNEDVTERLRSCIRECAQSNQRSLESEGSDVRFQEHEDEKTPPKRSSLPIEMDPDVEMGDTLMPLLIPPTPAQPAIPPIPSSIGTGASHNSTPWSSSTSTTCASSTTQRMPHNTTRHLASSVELEAVVSCTSDGLVVILRRARPPIPDLRPPLIPFVFDNGLFAAPWGQQPIRPHYSPEILYNFRPPYLPQHMPLRENIKASGGPPLDQLMKSIRDVAVFAWAVVGINGNLASYSRGCPMGESQPPDGLPIWDPAGTRSSDIDPKTETQQHHLNCDHRETMSSDCSQPSLGAYVDGDSMTFQPSLSDQDKFTIRNGNQWPSRTPPRTPHWLRRHYQPYLPTQHNDDPLTRHPMTQSGQLSSFALYPPTRWYDGTNSSGSFWPIPSPGQDPARFHYPL